MRFIRSLSLPGFLLCLAWSGALGAPALAQSWQPLQHMGPFQAGMPLLMTDGTVIVHNISSRDWQKLTPDESGSYVHGTWSDIARLPTDYGPLYFASAVLADGRVIVMGGEYNFGSFAFTKKGAVYDPLANNWTSQPAPTLWNSIGDAQCCVLPDGRFLLADPLSRRSAVLNPATLTWSPFGSGKADNHDEEGWTLLPDGTILTVDAPLAPQAERFLPSLGQWIHAGNTPQSLVDPGSLEMGPGVLMHDGNVFWVGGTGHNAVYTPPQVLTDPGTWQAAPDFPLLNGSQLEAADGPACLLPNGKVFCVTSPGVFVTPLRFFEFDGTSLTGIPRPPRAAQDSCYQCNFLVLPTGEVLFTDFSSDIEVYTSPGAPDDAWRPTISACPTLLRPGETYLITGTQFNGLSQTCFYGDDSTNATNYPLVRLTGVVDGHVHYARTHGHSTMAVATGSTPTSTHFTLPGGLPNGDYQLEVVANGIPSFPFPVRVQKIRASGPPIDLTH